MNENIDRRWLFSTLKETRMLAMDLKTIGKVKRLSDQECRLEIRSSFTKGLDGLRPGDKIQVLYWMHELSFGDRRTLITHPGGDTGLPPRGVFSLRSCVRPNPIGVTVAEITQIEGSQIVVLGLDAHDGAPIIDIKACAG
jgi:tRNA-Thr(GGU) m(6)t(6)A37 methyltransferase TsaA